MLRFAFGTNRKNFSNDLYDKSCKWKEATIKLIAYQRLALNLVIKDKRKPISAETLESICAWRSKQGSQIGII
jgi:DNA-binding Xre family transcriptional regulator